MKKAVVLIGVFLVAGLMVFTLFNNKAEMEKKAKVQSSGSYPVSVVAVARRQIGQTISQVGTIVANNDVAVIAENSGKVTAVMAAEGSYVQKGSPLLKIDDLIPEANFLAAQTNYEKAQKDYESFKSLYAQGLISESDLDSARLAFKSAEAQFIGTQRQYHNSVITSPITGVVTARPVDIGTMVNPGMVVANVIDNSLFKVKLNIGEKDAFKLRVGDTVAVTTDVYPGIEITGKVKSISDKADGSHTYPVQVTIPNSKQYPLKSGMFGTVTFDLGKQDALMIPRNAIVGSIKNPQVFVVENGVARLRNVLAGIESGTDIAVTQGLSEGEKVVISGQSNLRDQAKVTVMTNQ